MCKRKKRSLLSTHHIVQPLEIMIIEYWINSNFEHYYKFLSGYNFFFLLPRLCLRCYWISYRKKAYSLFERKVLTWCGVLCATGNGLQRINHLFSVSRMFWRWGKKPRTSLKKYSYFSIENRQIYRQSYRILARYWGLRNCKQDFIFINIEQGNIFA